MRNRYILTAAVLTFGSAIFAACSDPVAAPLNTRVPAFARNPSGSPDKNKSCTQDGGTRKSSTKNEKNACALAPSFKLSFTGGLTPSNFTVRYLTSCVLDSEVWSPDASGATLTTDFTSLCVHEAYPNIMIFGPGGTYVTATASPAQDCSSGEGAVCFINVPEVTITIAPAE